MGVSEDLNTVARAMVAPGKGILAADESTPTIKKRFDSVSVESTEENRRSYREMLFTAPGVEQYIGGVIMYEETLYQRTADGTPFPQYLAERGIVPGIKVDEGAKALALFPGEKVTEGLDGLRDRLADYVKTGARFAKWRAVIDIADGIPSDYCLLANAHALARYAGLCQEAGVVPIVEPEVLMDGAHDIARCEQVTNRTLELVFEQLDGHRIDLTGMILKPNMVIAGKKCPQQAPIDEIAAATVRCLKAHVPAAVPGIAFLSGGQSEEEATANLNAMNKLGPHPWELSFSYGRALQTAALHAWAGRKESLPAGQSAFEKRAKLNHLARSGQYEQSMEKAA